MKKLICALALLLPFNASAHPELQAALHALNEAKMSIAQGRPHQATNAILDAESSIYRVLGETQRPQRKAWLCSFTYNGNSFEGRGDSEDEARRLSINDCLRKQPTLGALCQSFANN